MEGEFCKEQAEMEEKIFQIFKDFMTRVTMLEGIGDAGSRLVSGFQQGLEFLQKPPINTESELIQNIIKSNETRRLNSCIKAGCTNSYDSIQNSSKSKSILSDMETLVKDLTGTIQMSGECLSHVLNGDSTGPSNQQSSDQLMEPPHSDRQELKMLDYAALTGIIYSMLKQDYLMQERIVTSLNLKTSSGELESYCMMWSLRPYIKDEILHQALGLIR